VCCELLSKVDIFDIRNNYQVFSFLMPAVVNCSQKLISLIFGTTRAAMWNTPLPLWIALKSWYLWYSEQRNLNGVEHESRCELLSKVDIFDIRNNGIVLQATNHLVVNCSQKLISLIFGTTIHLFLNRTKQLWIALKSWYLWYSEQLKALLPTCCLRCELLSKVDIFDIRNNRIWIYYMIKIVVNCSQKLISLIFGTTINNIILGWLLLWIALKSWYLWYSEQPNIGELLTAACCELLSKVDIFDIRNNQILGNCSRPPVVNCSQKLISLIFGTTRMIRDGFDKQLWIALKSWYLWYSEQRGWSYQIEHFSCELLSKVDIFDIRNNLDIAFNRFFEVVNCSQKLISLIFGTTEDVIKLLECELWIALKSWYLWYSEQRKIPHLRFWSCCELLSKVDIFDIRNNQKSLYIIPIIVVNCSQKLISLIFGTTQPARTLFIIQLWIALKSWYLWYSEQQSCPR